MINRITQAIGMQCQYYWADFDWKLFNSYPFVFSMGKNKNLIIHGHTKKGFTAQKCGRKYAISEMFLIKNHIF